TASERRRLESSYSPASGNFMDVSVLHEDTSSWGRGEDTVLRYSLERGDTPIAVEGRLGYLASFNAGGPIRPLSYITPTWCAFQWDFPILDFKVLNNRQDTLFLTEVVFDVEESRLDLSPFLTLQSQRGRGQARFQVFSA